MRHPDDLPNSAWVENEIGRAFDMLQQRDTPPVTLRQAADIIDRATAGQEERAFAIRAVAAMWRDWATMREAAR